MQRVKLKELEIHFVIRRTRQVRKLAGQLPPGEATRLLSILTETKDGSAYDDELLVLIDSLLFEARVRDAIVSDLRQGEHVEPHPEADIGEPLLHLSHADGIRIGIFAMFAPSEEGQLSAEFDDEFIDVLPNTGTDALILISCVRDRGYLAALSARIQRELGLPVTIEHWRPRGQRRSLRSSINRLSDASRATRTVTPPP